MPAISDPLRDPRARLLEASERLFAERGFAAVSVRDIAAAAQVNVAAVNYYFQGKQRLYLEVLRQAVAAKAERYLASVREAAAAPDASLAGVVAAFFRTHLDHTLRTTRGGHFMRLMVRELHHGSAEGAGVLREALMPMWLELGRHLVGMMPGVSPAVAPWIAGSLHGQLVHFTMRWHKVHAGTMSEQAVEAFQALFPPLADDVDTYIERAVDHVTRFSVAGIEAVAAAAADPQEDPS